MSIVIITAVAYALAGCYVLYILYFFLGFRRLRPHPLKPDRELPPLTVIVCAKDEEADIAKCIGSVSCAGLSPEKFSVIAVDDRSADRTGSILDALAEEHETMKVLHLASCPAGVSPKKHAISRALEICKTEFVVATDADAEHRKQWLRSYGSLCRDKLGAATGLSMFRKDAFTSAAERIWQSMQTLENLSHNMVMAGAMMNGFAITANGNNMLYRKELFQNGEPLKGHIVSGDDSDIIYEAQRQGYEVCSMSTRFGSEADPRKKYRRGDQSAGPMGFQDPESHLSGDRSGADRVLLLSCGHPDAVPGYCGHHGARMVGRTCPDQGGLRPFLHDGHAPEIQDPVSIQPPAADGAFSCAFHCLDWTVRHLRQIHLEGCQLHANDCGKKMKKVLSILLKIGVSVGLLWWLSRYIDLQELLGFYHSLPLSVILGVLGLSLLNIAGQAARFISPQKSSCRPLP
ncbi:MAG: glycosyltransferase [Candidatus Marinimicrobia bacterium]|nr:glycosyltransferase [Candidatus Neomarinimicrobiota bacterium]